MSEQFTFFAPTALPPAAFTSTEMVEESFREFWQAYPKRPNNPKAPARLAWGRALRTATIAEIMEGLARYRFSPDPQYRPMAVTWLNQKRYRDVEPDLTIDPYGLSEWLESLPRDGGLSAHCYDIEDIRPILIATGWEPSWRGSLDILNGWLRDGYIPDSCAKVIAAAVAEFGGRASLAAFDKRVRFRAQKINSDR